MKNLSERRIKQLLSDDAAALVSLDFTAYEFEQALREILDRRDDAKKLDAVLRRFGWTGQTTVEVWLEGKR